MPNSVLMGTMRQEAFGTGQTYRPRLRVSEMPCIRRSSIWGCGGENTVRHQRTPMTAIKRAAPLGPGLLAGAFT